jgi:septal ring-binding cell division protein DamX
MPAALFQTARISYEKGRYPEAQRELDHYLQVSQHTAETLWLAVQIARALGNKEAAEQYAQQLQTEFSQSEEAQSLVDAALQSDYERISPTPRTTVSTGPITVTAKTRKSFKREDWVLAQDPQNYTVQLFASQNELAMPYFRDQYGLTGELAYYATQRGNTTWYELIWGNFEDKKRAENAITQLPQELRGAAQVQQFGDLQAGVRRLN